MGGAASTANKEKPLGDKIPEMPADVPSPDSPHHISLHRTRSGLTDCNESTIPAAPKKGKRRSSVTSSTDSKEVFDMDKLMKTSVSPKLTEDTKKQVIESIQHFFFPTTAQSSSSDSMPMENNAEIELFLKALVRETSPADSFAMKEGDVATKLYILESGDVEVTIGGNFIRNMGPGSLFGELALIYNAPRSASIKCTGDCVFWVLSRTNYQGILNVTRSHDVTQRLMECPEICNELGYVGRSKLLKSLKMHTYEKDEVIFEQGAVIDKVVLIESGKTTVTSVGSTGTNQPIVYNDLHIDCPEEECKQVGTTSETFQLAEGFIFGIPVVNGHVQKQSNGMWVYNAEKNNILCPVRLVATEKAQCATFSIEYFESLRKLDPPQKSDQESTRRISTNYEDLDSNEDFGVIKDYDVSQMKLHLITSQGSRSAHAIGNYSNGKEYSIKYVSKANIVSKSNKEIDEFFNESDMLRTFHCRFIQKMCCVFETRTSVAFATEELDRGDLFSAIYENTSFPTDDGGIPSELIKFYTCSIASALSYLHEKNVSYRDLKPENCMMDAQGYLKLTEFSFAKKIPFFSKDRWGRRILQIRSTTICGTPEYMAPEFILCTGNDHGVDLWSLGILLYEMIQLITPFAIEDDNNVQELFKRITRIKLIASDILYLDPNIDEKMDKSSSARQLIENLLKGNADARLGYEDGQQVLQHAFFNGFDVAGVAAGTYVPPYIPPQSFLTGINVGETAGKFADPSSFFDAMSNKEDKRYVEFCQNKHLMNVL